MKFRIIKRGNIYVPQAKFLFWWYDLFTININLGTLEDARAALIRHRYFPKMCNVVYQVEVSRNKIKEDYL